MWIIILLIIGSMIWFQLKRRKRAKGAMRDNRIQQSYTCDEGNFVMCGKKEQFIISKNDQFEFLVKDGQIVACKDKRAQGEFVYYGGEQ